MKQSSNADAGAVMTDEEIIERCKVAGIKWIPPELDDEEGSGFPGMFDMATVNEMRALLAAPTAVQAEAVTNAVTLDRRDLFDFVRGAIKGALEDASNEAAESREPMCAADCWSDAHTRTEAMFDKLSLGDTAALAASSNGERS